MKNITKILFTAIMSIAILLAISVVSSAATVKITADFINVRKEASTSSNVIATLSKDVECEYLGEEGEWYKVKYQRYTGYVSKEYSELIGEKPEIPEETEKANNTEEINNTETSDNTASQNTQVSNESQENNSATNAEGENDINQEENTDSQGETNISEETAELQYKEFNKNTNIRILPLIYSSNIGQAKKGEEVLILTETTGWSYIQTDEISGWVRTDTLGEDSKQDTTQTETEEKEPTSENTERTGYISENNVNMRSGAGTSYSVIRVLKLNTEVTVISEKDNWAEIEIGNTKGYVSKDYVSESKTVTSRSLSEPRTDKDENKETENKTETAEKVATKQENTSKEDSTTTANKVSQTTTKKPETSNEDTVKGTDIVAYAKEYLGNKYVWGGDGSNGTFDCSGFTMYVYKHFGVNLPHYTVSQYNSSKGKKITKQKDLKMGDIVFLTDYETGAKYGHCGIYISDGDFIHADSSVGYVNISNLNDIYKNRFCGALRVF